MATDLEHDYETDKPLDENFAAVTDLEKVIPCVEGGRVVEATSQDLAQAEIVVAMGAMSMKFTGTVEVTEKDPEAHRAVLTVRSKEVGGQGHANATVVFALSDGGGTVNTNAQITGKAASMGEGVVAGVLEALIKDFTGKLSKL
jgi:carbon monoxide dehydrogenase subunit G